MGRYLESEFSPIHPDVVFGENVKMGHYVVIEEDCEFGDGCFIGNFTNIRHGCKFGKQCSIEHLVTCAAFGVFGDHVTIKAHSNMAQGIKVGNHTFISVGVMTMNTRNISYGRRFVERIYTPPIIGNHVRIGAGAVILPGVVIEDNAVVGAGSVVTRDVAECTIVMGNPARFVRNVPEEEWL